MTDRKKRVIGILAHVDAGKTTLSEGMLFTAGAIRSLGRVDHKDAFLDTESLERERGITIFSKQAKLEWKDRVIQLLDTPGHVDFSGEMERTLSVLDAAVLVISATDGVQSHTRTLWKLLARYEIPTFLFINKMDLFSRDAADVLSELQSELSGGCQDFSAFHDEAWMEAVAMSDEELINVFLENGTIAEEVLAQAVQGRKLFPCFFGSALKCEGIGSLLDGMESYLPEPVYGNEFAARVYKITRDESGNRLTWMRVTGGKLRVREALDTGADALEKVSQIRLYSGKKYETLDEVTAGTICAVLGIEHTKIGDGLGAEQEILQPVLQPVMTYQLVLPEGCDAFVFLGKLRKLEEEDPMLHVLWNERYRTIHLQLMGEVQTEVLRQLIWDRYHEEIEFASGHIVYKETVAAPVEGVGHYEPLRHYAEVHLLIEPGEPGSGIEVLSACKEDVLDRNWQRLILTHLTEREHLGVLTGSVLTDVRITLLTGKAHLKHTEGGDFRQATYRALRQGLKKAQSVLLEPYYRYVMELPKEATGRAMNDILQMNGTIDEQEVLSSSMTRMTGVVSVEKMQGYQKCLHAYTHGEGRLSVEHAGYRPVHNQDDIVAEIGYDSERDIDNPTGSVFCAHGAGFVVPWYEVEEYMHLENCYVPDGEADHADAEVVQPQNNDRPRKPVRATSYADDKELEEIFTRTFGAVKRRTAASDTNLGYEKTVSYASRIKKPVDTSYPRKPVSSVPEYLIVDGYNVIFAWEELGALANKNLDAARDLLNDILCNYQGYHQCNLTVVYDAYKRKGNAGSRQAYNNISVVYTKEGQTADMYIEELVRTLGKKCKITVATSDSLEQLTVSSGGALRMSARELELEIQETNRLIREAYLDREFPKE
ncbi:MAG: TetM/TetW/TetO/TetS family tetracycline resistance ribosomal protection protein [bacterium]|nr:TetM/TetW/TetO/TetS family tetracycline resistance ribosomal protection protein [bacterium]